MYKPKIIKGKVSGTGWPIDGHELYLSMWAYDNYSSWHLYSWEDEADEAVMMTMFQSEVEAGFISEDERESFVAKWKAHEWESPGVFTLDLDKVEELEVIAEEEKDEARERARAPKPGPNRAQRRRERREKQK